MSTCHDVLHCFPLLPKELRLAIWKECLPRRVVEIDIASSMLTDTYCDVWSTSLQNARSPLISRVCRESREVAVRHGVFLRNHLLDILKQPDWGTSNMLHDQWVNFETDIVHMHYDESYNDDEWPNWGNRFRFFHSAAKIAAGASITSSLVYDFYTPTLFRYNEYYEELCRDEYQVVLKTVHVHLTEDQARRTNLFGITGEEVVKCVDAYNAHAFHALKHQVPDQDKEAKDLFTLLGAPEFIGLVQSWEQRLEKSWLFTKWADAIGKRRWVDWPEDFVNHHYRVGTVWTQIVMSPPPSMPTRGYLRHPDTYAIVETNPWVMEVLRSRPRFRPVVMFRLCLQDCWAKPKIDYGIEDE